MADWKGDDDGDDFEDENELLDLNDLSKAVVFLFQSEAFEQLRARMRAESLLSSRDGQAIQSIRTTILSALDSPDSRFGAEKLRTAKFSISWNPFEFLQQQYAKVNRSTIKDIITLTGAATDAQAITCELYVKQVWPLVGDDALLVLQEIVNDPTSPYSRRISFLPL